MAKPTDNKCPRCRYDMSGLEEKKCPECQWPELGDRTFWTDGRFSLNYMLVLIIACTVLTASPRILWHTTGSDIFLLVAFLFVFAGGIPLIALIGFSAVVAIGYLGSMQSYPLRIAIGFVLLLVSMGIAAVWVYRFISERAAGV